MSADLSEVERLDRVEAVLKAHGLHEPTCPEFERIQAQRSTTMYLYPRECDCWLRPPASDVPGSDG